MTTETKKQRCMRAWKKKWRYLVAIIPSLVLYFIFCVYPNISVFPLSLYEWSPLSSTKTFVGLQNFRMIFVISKDETVQIILNTVTYVLALLIIQTLLGMIFALMLHKNTKIRRGIRTYFYIPKILSVAVVGLTWQYMYDPNLGIINNILGALGVEGFPGTFFFKEAFTSVIMVVCVHIWANMGHALMYLISGFTTISDDLYEAAKIDGANGWKQFWHITLPLLTPSLSRYTLLTMTTGVMTADYLYVLEAREADNLASHIFRMTRSGTAYGMVSAYGVLMFIVVGALMIIQFVSMNKIEKSIME